jgi:uncharacterized protein (TIGR02996 family)
MNGLLSPRQVDRMPVPLDRAFLDDIQTHPDDDAPRLIYADWLADNGSPARAEFIRVQIERARLDEDDPAQDELERREHRLLREHPEWLTGLPKWAQSSATFRRGFVEAILGAAGQVRRELERVVRLAPVRGVTIEFYPSRPLQVPVAPATGVRRLCLFIGHRGQVDMIPPGFWDAFPDLEDLELRLGPLEGKDIDGLLVSALPGRLRRLRLVASLINPETRRQVLARHDLFAPLESLELHTNQFGAETFAELAAIDMPYLRNLRLEYESGRILPQTFPALLSIERRPRLESLALVSSGFAVPSVEALASTPGLARLRDLDFGNNQIDAAHLAQLLESPHWPTLRWLSLAHNPLGRNGVRALAGCPKLATLTRLDLGGVGMRLPGVTELVRSPYLGSLRRLNVWGNQLGDDGILALVAGTLPPLAELNLQGNNLTDRGVQALVEGAMELPVRLNLSHNRLTMQGFVTLANSPRARRLGSLDLYGSNRLAEASAALTASPFLDGLWRLRVRLPEDSAALRARFSSVLVE